MPRPEQFTPPSPEHDNAHILMPDWLKPYLPPLYATEHEADPTVICKYFTPDSHWTWYVQEFDGEDLCFGYVQGLDNELGYFSLTELQAARGPLGLQIERDLYFDPTPLSALRRDDQTP